MSVVPFATTARVPVEYTPLVQDAERYEREKREQMRRAASQARANDVALDRSKVDEEEAFMLRNVATMRQSYPTPMVFLLQTPTETEREQLNSRLISLGLNQITQEQIRATMIEELFEHDWGKGDQNEAHAEELANFLDGVWQRQEAHDAAIDRWREQELERVLDEVDGAPKRERGELPPKLITVRENARTTLLIDTMMRTSQKLRDMAARAADFSRQHAIMLVRVHVIGATQGVTVKLERDPRSKALPEDQVLALREEMDEASWLDLVARIDSMYRVTKDEEKNSDLPLEKQSPPNGSIEPSGDTSGNGGSSTISTIDPAPAVASEKITAKSSGFTYADVPEPVAMPRPTSPAVDPSWNNPSAS